MDRAFPLLLAAWIIAGAAPCRAAPAAEFNVTSVLQLKVGGSLQLDYTAGRAVTDTGAVRKARLRFEAHSPELPDFVMKLQTEFTQNPALLDLFLEFSRGRPLPDFLKMRLAAGQLKPPFGREHLVNDDLLETVNRSAAVEALVPGRDTGTKGRDVGGLIELAASPRDRKNLIVYRAGVFNGEGANVADKNDQKNFITRLELNPFEWMSLGGSYMNGRRGSPRKVQDRWGWDAKASYGPAAITYEQIYGTSDTVRAKGQYVLGTLWVWQKTLQAAVRYDWFDPSLSAQSDRTYTTTFGLNWHPAAIIKVTANYELRRGLRNNDTFIFSVLGYF